MFLHNLKYEFLQNIRQKELIGWMMLFPIVLATLFYVAFGNIYEKEKVFSEIDIAVVEVTKDDIFNTVLDELSTGDEPLFSVKYTDRENAEKLLRDGDVLSIIYVDKEMTMSA
ncbi:MAG: ABC transporter permease, partial [Ruminococcus sp.]|nr:ABC transporter permease [Ruminococcus sp.]